MASPTSILRAAAALAALAPAALAQNAPFFTVANGGPSGLPGDVVFEATGITPIPIGGGPGMGLGRPGDDITGIAPVVPLGLLPTKDFVICFSVDPFAVGKFHGRITLQNLLRQALNNQQAGDAYLTTEAFRRGVGILPPPFSMGLFNNALAANQSKRYPNTFGLLPAADAGQFVPPGTLLDDVNATLNFTDFTPPNVYFTLSADSPSLPFLPGADSGATIHFDSDFQNPGGEDVYANPTQLGLDFLDQISGLIVVDDDLNNFYDGTDTVYVTLAPDSPTLSALGLLPGDVLVIEGGVPALFVEGVDLGLLPGDNMDALDMVPLINDSAEDTINMMVDCPADYNDDTIINTLDVLAFLNGWNAGEDRADMNGDGAIDTLDVLVFLTFWAGGC